MAPQSGHCPRVILSQKFEVLINYITSFTSSSSNMANESGGDSEASSGNPYARTFSNRGPNKRKVKPSSQSQLLQFAMFSDSEDDEDFVASSDDDDYSSDNSGDRGHEIEANESRTEVEEATKPDSPPLNVEKEPEIAPEMNTSGVGIDDESEDEDYEPVSYESAKSSDESGENNDASYQDAHEPVKDAKKRLDEVSSNLADVSTVPKKTEKLVCGICLESVSTEEDELVECDWCGITVHEGCYGSTEESVSEDRSDSDTETEPWFCDACKAKCEGHCELCPVKGGILKQTDSGQWVHLVCALYVPGVGFRDVDKLQNVVIDEISSSRWGSRRCILCEDQRFSKTGICIECDAGMCKTYFHAMCAQMHGLLTEVPAAGHLNDDDADPLFAHCRLHTDKTVLKARLKRWTAFDAHLKDFKPVIDPDEKSRIEDAYQRAVSDYIDFRRSLPPAVLQTIDEPRLMTSSPELCGKLLRKAELVGYSTDTQEITMNITAYIRACKPTLSCDFINHFFKRETLTSKYQSEEKPLRNKIEKHKEEQIALQENYGILKLDLENLKSKRADLYSKVTKLNSALEKILGKKVALPSYIARPKRKQRRDSGMNIDALIHTCETCKGTGNQHLMALCDTCQNYYHIGCLDPPLLALPKKSSKWLWQCTECDKSESSAESIDTEEGPSSRKRKRKTNAPKKFTPSDENTTNKKIKGKSKVAGHGKVGRPRKQRIDPECQEIMTPPEKVTVERKPSEKRRRGKKRKPQVSLRPCIVCSKEGDNKNMVKCDECSNCYHFECCEPKLRAHPKKRGYMWFCNDCAESDEEGEDDGNEDEDSEEGLDDRDEVTNKQSKTLVPNENGIYDSTKNV